MSFKVTVKWGKEKLSVDVDTSEPVEVFNAQVYALSGVPPDRQKIMMKGKTLKDSWAGFPAKANCTLMMIGSADPLYKPPEKKALFIEDMDDGEKAKVLNIPLGFENLGNTCYMNSVIQALRTCPELKTALDKYSSSNKLTPAIHDQGSLDMADKMKELFAEVKKSTAESISPLLFLLTLRKYNPHFGDRDPQTQAPMQQDANECLTILQRNLQAAVPSLTHPNAETIKDNVVDQFFGIDFKSTLSCTESDAEPQVTNVESELQLSCFLDKEVKYLMSGINNRLSGELEKRSEVLGRNAIWKKDTKINRLPAYLSVQMVRFFYKEGKNGASGTNAKILKDVKFQSELDLFEQCSDELKLKLDKGRKKFIKYEEYVHENKAKLKNNDPTADKDIKMSFLETPHADSPDKIEYGSNQSGFYELYAVLTHKGRSSSSGHYVTWSRPDPLSDKWYLFDDDNVSEVSEDQILKLSGGGDWHTSYVLIYGPKRIGSNFVNTIASGDSSSTQQKSSIEEMKE